MRTGAAGDGASTHVLEAITMTIVMVASIAFVVTIDLPPSESSASRVALAMRASDALAILDDTPVRDSSLGTNELSVALLDCLQQRCARLAGDLDRLMPIGSRSAVYLSTGHGLYPIYAPVEPAGEAVSVRRLVEPAWSYQFMATSLSIVDPLDDPLVVYALPVHSANPIHQGGSQLTIVATGNHTSDHAAYIMKSSGATRAVGPPDDLHAAAISVYFHGGDGAALASTDVRAQTLTGFVPSETPVQFHARVEESAGGVLPAGATLTIAIPRGWSASASQAENDEDWVILTNATDRNASARASSVVAKLRHDVTSAAVDLHLNATYWGSSDDYATFDAHMAGGAFARAALLVRADQHVLRSPYEVPGLVASIPRPLGTSATTTWTLAAFSSHPISITRIEIAEDEGRAIFADAASLTGGGAWTAEPDRLIWTGDAQIDHDSPLNLTFHVTSSALHGPSIERAPFVPSVDLDDYTGALVTETAPGFHRGIFVPATSTRDGYNGTITGIATTHTLASASVYRTTPLPGQVDYKVGVALGLKDSVFGSAVTSDHRYAAPGDTLTLHAEVQSIIYQLASLGLEPSIHLTIYPPWAGNDRTPIYHAELYNGTLAKGAGTFLGLVDTNGDGTPDNTTIGRLTHDLALPAWWLYGPYVIEVNINWLEDIGPPGATDPLIRTARVYDYFVVRPPNGDLPSSPIYDIHLVSWYEDWG